MNDKIPNRLSDGRCPFCGSQADVTMPPCSRCWLAKFDEDLHEVLVWPQIDRMHANGEFKPIDLWRSALNHHSLGWFSPGKFYIYTAWPDGRLVQSMEQSKPYAYGALAQQDAEDLYFRHYENVWVLSSLGAWNAAPPPF